MHPAMIRKIGTAFAAIALTASVASAQTDPRWRAWTGCWTPITQNTFSSGSAVCVLPTDKPSAVEIVNVVGSKVADRTRIDADGVEHPVSRDGCTGTELVRWSASGTRVHITESLRCTGGGVRRGTGIMSFNQQYEWLDVRGLSSGGAAGVAVARYRLSNDTAGLPAEVAPALALRGPTGNMAILAASAPLTLADIAEIGTTVDSGVAATWLVERTRDVQLSVSGKQLVALADQGVPSAVIDVVVALAHPRVFALSAGSTDPQMRDQPARSGTNLSNYRWGIPSYYDPFYSGFNDPWFGGYYGYYSPFSMYGISRYGYRGGYGSGYGYGYPSYGYGYYPGSQPIVIVNQDQSDSRPHGRVVRGRGYTSGTSSSGASGGSTTTSSSSGSSTSGGGTTGSGSSGAAASGGSASGSSGGGGGDRTAVRKPPL